MSARAGPILSASPVTAAPPSTIRAATGRPVERPPSAPASPSRRPLDATIPLDRRGLMYGIAPSTACRRLDMTTPWPDSPLRALSKTFGYLTRGPAPLALDCRSIPGLPGRSVAVDELRRRPLHRGRP